MKVRDKYDVPVSPLLHVYTIVHFALSFLVTDFISASAKVLISKNLKLFHHIDKFQTSSQGALLVTILYCLWGLTNIGLLYDQVTNQSSVFRSHDLY